MKERETVKKRDESLTVNVVQTTTEEIIIKVKELAEPLCLSEGLELVFVECLREPNGRVIRLYIDKPGGITVNDCTQISRQLNDILDVNLNTNWSYNLEVSSPGYDRPLGKPEDFERFKGNTARIRTLSPVEGQKNFKGVILGFFDGFVKINVNDKNIAIPFKLITKARLFEYNGENRCLYQK
ncbi:MAG: ribosome maturation factor RimP [Desulfobacterales bacterium]